jgi:glycosyltransferase involved in cell wall biosynthesis
VKIFGWLADRQGCGYYRLILPGTELANRGHHVWLDEEMPEHAKTGEFDVIVGQRVCQPGASATWQKLARAGHTKLVFETDDLLSHPDPSNKPAHRFYDAATVERYHQNMAVADVVTVSTEPLAEYCREINPNVVVLPNQVPAWLLDHERAHTERLTIGWRGGRSHSRDFGELAAPLRRFLQHPDHRDRVELHAMGVDYTGRVASARAVTRHAPWQSSVDAFLRAVDFDLAVIPLRPSPFNDCKSDLALLEMSALGIPSIVSSAGPYADAHMAGAPSVLVLNDSRTGKPAGWLDALRELANDDEYRVQLGKSAREWAARRTVQGNAWRWEEAYSNA